MGVLNTAFVDRVANLAFGCTGIGLAVGTTAAVAPALAIPGIMGFATVGALAFAARAKHGPEARSTMRRIVKRLREERRRDSEYGYAEQAELDRIAQAFNIASEGAMLSPPELARLLVDADFSGFPDRASAVIIDAVSKIDTQFKSPGLAHDFAKDVLKTALTAAIEDKAYFETLQPHLLVQTAEGMGRVLAFLERMEADAVAKGRQLDDMQSTLESFANDRLPQKLLIKLVHRVDDTNCDTAEAMVTTLLGRLEAAEALIKDGHALSNLPDFVDAVEKRIAEQVEAGEFDAADSIATDALSDWRERQAEQKAAGASLIDAAIRTARLNADDLDVAAKRIADLECEKLMLERGTLQSKESASCLDEYRKKIERRANKLDVRIARRLLDIFDTSDANASNKRASGSLHSQLSELGYAGHLDVAISAFERALEEWTQDRVPLDWASTQNNLGNAYLTKARRGDAASLDLAIEAYERALEEWTQDRVPLNWATTQNNLGNAYLTKARRGDAASLGLAIEAYERALEEWTQDRVPLDWASTQNNLGNAYLTKARRGDAASLDLAIEAYERALEEWTQDRVPLNWATTQNNLGNAYMAKAERGDAASLDSAIEAYERALEEWTQDRVPLDWAMTQNNLGNAYMAKAERGDAASLGLAIEAYERALEEWTQDRVPLDWAMTQINLGNAESHEAKIEGRSDLMRIAVKRRELARETFLKHGHQTNANICEQNNANDQAWLNEHFPDGS